MNVMKQLNIIYKKLKKQSIWLKLLIVLLLIYVVNYAVNKYDTIENFSNQDKKFEVKRDDLFDDFYVNIYDKLVYSEYKNDFEIGEISRHAKIGQHSRILDIGSGTGHHVNLFLKKGVECVGLDKSASMIKKAKELYPGANFKKGDVLNSMTFDENSFTHITCFYFTVYYIKDKMTFFNNCYNWLKPGGKFIVHLVNKNKFDPIIPLGNPLHVVNPQKYAKKRITDSVVKFNGFKYKASFDLNGDDGKFKEIIKFDKNNNIRVNEHKLYMNSQLDMLSMMKDTGFLMLGKISLHPTQYDYQYIYILQKPE